ncbi:hypothetical protein SAMN05421505_10139 [Sinosporangium album]|uniref:Uncharacterized protein n=1 Tax=Sinosporangium album TaxID=504805 RepID=A0A1G7QM20_9ACTN|nr:hypothetical protein SAMN05421505_10139 [Sinosporangium album]
MVNQLKFVDFSCLRLCAVAIIGAAGRVLA